MIIGENVATRHVFATGYGSHQLAENMMAALDLGCKHLSVNFDTVQNRTRIGDAIISAPASGKRTLAQFIDVALHEVVAIMGPEPSAMQAMIGCLKRCIKRH